MENTALRNVEKLALKKQKVFDQSIIKYLLRAMLASAFIGFGVIVAFKTGNLFYAEHSPVAYPIAALTFGIAIVLIAYAGGDLFTGNTFYFTYTALRGNMSWKRVIQMWISSYSGNIIGAFFFAGLISLTGLFASHEVNGFLMSVVEGKMNTPASELFFRAILCNWLVCLAFYVPMALKGDGPKLFTMIFLVFGFFISGYEHSIANMSTFSIALVLDHPDAISIGKALHNLIPVILGNMVGGTAFMALLYYYLGGPNSDDEDEFQEDDEDYSYMNKK
ncbi:MULTISPECIES: formate/nitrite transporter family protein [unclassified Viridibacillus]|uniref:formate/nitrite transporter family protein n=1 Tax=unclassified Viridibacillus TaxID=2617942 RepID=UPI00096F1248|nr:formate/nitrite transporter family protein [Viridibacillus sp. FSL H7-0596]OMC87234.1 transporter [Viridibacillus sp. FSL H7-0596]